MTSVPAPRPATTWLSVDEVAALADVPASEVRKAAQERKLSGVSSHPAASRGDWMFRSNDVDAWLAAR
jgi:hypothetical protein